MLKLLNTKRNKHDFGYLLHLSVVVNLKSKAKFLKSTTVIKSY